MKMKMKMLLINKTNRRRRRHRHKYTKYKRVAVRSCLYVISNTEATFEAQFIKKLSNTEAKL